MDIEVGIESFRDKLRLYLPSKVLGVKKYIYTRLPDSDEGWRQARQQAVIIESDIAAGKLDITLERYKPRDGGTYLSTVIEIGQSISLTELWEKYTKYRTPQVSETTLKLNYKRIASHIEKCPYKGLEGAVAIRDYLLNTTSPYTAKRVLTQLNACCSWALDSKLIDRNPFIGMAGKIDAPTTPEQEIDPFSKEERDAIIQAFQEHPKYKHYANFVRFLFMTGCRTSEAVGLRWGHISKDCLKIVFSEAIVNVSSRGIKKDTKTHKPRRFPCNSALQELLLSIRPKNYSREDLVFTSLTGDVINSHTFSAMCWKGTKVRGTYHEGIVTKLVREGKVERYRPQYNTRHSFITYCVEAGVTPTQVGKWVGNSAEMIMTHYCGVLDRVQVPVV